MIRELHPSLGGVSRLAIMAAFAAALLAACAPRTTPVDTSAPGNIRAEHSPACSSAAQSITVPDPALAEQLRSSLRPGQPATTEFACTELAQLIRLRVADVENLDGLQYAVNLNSLNLNGSPVTSLEPLSGLTRLTSLSVVGGSLTSLSTISGLPALAVLKVDDNDIADLSPLADRPQLAYLSAARNSVSDISVLADLTNLYWLDLTDNHISDISPLASSEALDVLLLNGNQVSDTSALSGLVGLRRIDLAGNLLTDIDFMAELDVELLDVSSNRITSIAGLARNRALSSAERYDLRHNCIDLTSGDPFLQDLLERGAALLLEPQDQSCIGG